MPVRASFALMVSVALASSSAHATPPAEPASAVTANPDGVFYTPPAGWAKTVYPEATAFDVRLTPEPRANHAARIVVYNPVQATNGLAAQFETEWRRQIAVPYGKPNETTVVHYRGRLPGGVDAYFMGRFFERPNQTQAIYAVMYLLDLGKQTQTIVATTIGGWDGVNFPDAVDGSAHWALSQHLFGLLDSIRMPGRTASGPLFGAADIRGAWAYEDGSVGSAFVNAQTGTSAGTAVRGATSKLALGPDGKYAYGFSYYAFNPGTGSAIPPQAEHHDGNYEVVDDVLRCRPRQPGVTELRRKVVGAGSVATTQGKRRLLIVVGESDQGFKGPMWVPLWNRYDGVMHWYVEEAVRP